jgi:ParB-like chromosome segregation protein Spo0J
MVIENLQRENVHPLEEALGYEALMKKPSSSDVDLELGELPGAPRHTVQSIAAKVGKASNTSTPG